MDGIGDEGKRQGVARDELRSMVLDLEFWIQLVLIAGVLWGAWSVLRPRCDVKIVADETGIRSLKGIARRQESDLHRFFTKEVALARKVTIRGERKQNGRLRFRLSGKVDPGTQQQIRNYLVTLLAK